MMRKAIGSAIRRLRSIDWRRRRWGHGTVAGEAEINDTVKALAQSPIFDVGFYQAQTGIDFESAAMAASHYVQNRSFRYWSPSPLISLNRVRRDIRLLWAQAGIAGTAAMLEYYGSRESLRTDWSPLFEPRDLLSKGDRDDVDAVATFLDNLSDATVLPVIGSLRALGVTWKVAREHSITVARDLRKQIVESGGRPARKSYKQGRSLRRCDVTEQALVSIFMKVTDEPDVLCQALECVQQQTHTAWELLLIACGNTEPTLSVLDQLVEAEPRVRIINVRGAGSGEAHQRALDLASGQYIAMLDPSARWRDTYLSTMIAAIQDNGADVVHAVSRHFDESTKQSSFETGEVGVRQLQTSSYIDANAFLARADTVRAIGGFDPSLRAWDEHDLLIRLAGEAVVSAVPYLGVARPKSLGPTGLRPGPESSHWQWVVYAKHLLDWNHARTSLGERVRGRVSIIMPCYQEYAMTLRAVSAVVENSKEHDIEVLVIDNGSTREVSQVLDTAAALFPHTRVIRLPLNYNFAIGSNFGVIASTGEYVLFLNNDTAARPGWLAPLLRRLDDPWIRGVQPLLLYPDETIQSAGIEFLAADSFPQTPLAGHPFEDGRAMRHIPLRAATAAALLMRASEVVELRGFDPIFVNGSEDIDLCLRAVDSFGGRFAVAPDSIVEHHESKTVGRGDRIEENRRLFLRRWRGMLPEPSSDAYRALGLQIAHVGTDGGMFPAPRPIVVRPPKAVRSADGELIPRLRWSIKNPAPGGSVGLRWGDTHFIEDLALGLETLGQEVVTYRRSAQTGPLTALDDVNLAIRGQFPVRPHPGKINILWILSHPSKITVDELVGYDLIYAASFKWAKWASGHFSRDIQPLLQATDTLSFSTVRRPRPDSLSCADGAAVFVGQTRPNGPRKVVMDALGVGLDLRVWGELWERYIPTENIEGPYFPNDQLCALYQAARVVLSDHHPDMAREGFIANRLFDAVCSGARVVSDSVEGIELLFKGAVQVYRTPEELRWLTSEEGLRSSFPDDEAMAKIGREVAMSHSFTTRAKRLLTDATALWSTRHGDGLDQV